MPAGGRAGKGAGEARPHGKELSRTSRLARAHASPPRRRRPDRRECVTQRARAPGRAFAAGFTPSTPRLQRDRDYGETYIYIYVCTYFTENQRERGRRELPFRGCAATGLPSDNPRTSRYPRDNAYSRLTSPHYL